MLLRRVIEHVKTQNWTAVALDFVIVVVGVFVGIQVANWNEAQKDRKLAEEYLVRLSSDLAFSADRIRNDIDEMYVWHDKAMFVVRALEAGELAPEDEPAFMRGLVVGTRLQFVRGRYATLDELVSSGRLYLFNNADLRNTIVQTRSGIEQHQHLITLIGDRQTALTPTLQANFMVMNSNGESTRVAYEFASLSANVGFRNSFANSAHYLVINIQWLKGALEDVEALQALVDAELGRASSKAQTS